MPTELLLTLARIEARHLSDVVAQFLALLDAEGDDALARLTPNPYPDDAEAAFDFASATRDELLDARRADARIVLAGLAPHIVGASVDEPTSLVDVPLDQASGWSWLRTLAAVRLVIASRLGIADDDGRVEGDEGDERFAVYDWLGYRLDGLVRALEAVGGAD